MTTKTNTFAFALAKRAPAKSTQWAARPGVTVCGCSFTGDEFDNWAEDYDAFGNYKGRDKGQYC